MVCVSQADEVKVQNPCTSDNGSALTRSLLRNLQPVLAGQGALAEPLQQGDLRIRRMQSWRAILRSEGFWLPWRFQKVSPLIKKVSSLDFHEKNVFECKVARKRKECASEQEQ